MSIFELIKTEVIDGGIYYSMGILDRTKILKFFKNPSYRLQVLDVLGPCRILCDEDFLSKLFIASTGFKLHLKHPITFQEKIQWLKLYDRCPVYTTMVDKFAVKRYVAKKIGNIHIIPTLGVWNRFDDIDFEKLPEQFVLKCTHDSGSIIICKDKASFSKRFAKRLLDKHLRRNYFWEGANGRIRTCAQELLLSLIWPMCKTNVCGGDTSTDPNSQVSGLMDYKFYCFHGVPKFLYVSKGLEGNHAFAQMNFIDMEWNKAPFRRPDFMEFDALPPRPYGFEEMKTMSAILSENIPFVRVDWYSVNHHVYFSEMTFSTGGGFTPFEPYEWERKIGEWIQIPVGGLNFGTTQKGEDYP